jgi:CheY-like chemotaxis protein
MSYTRTHQGAGLGLAISRHLVAAMGGTLNFSSLEGEGTTVCLMLPLGLPEHAECQQAEAPQAADLAVPQAPAEALRILLVEDDIINLMSGEELLMQLGHAVHTAQHGGEALEAMRSHVFDCVLMDMQMGVMDGMEATRRIRAEASGAFDPATWIIAMTAYAMPGDRERFLEAGIDDYLSKPVGAKELVDALAKVQSSKR